ncbi:hypothetical protein Tco_0472194 [Tanacetum coccineum]
MSSHGWEKEKEASTHDWGRMSHHDTGTRVEKGVPAGRWKTLAKGKKTLGSSFEATSRAPVNVSRKLKKNGTPLIAQVTGRALGTKNGNYSQQKKYKNDHVEIHHIKQREGETTEAFMERFKAESMHVSGAPECMRISGFMHGITNLDLIKKLNDNIPKSVDEMMSVTIAFLRGKVAAANQSKKHVPPA